MTIDQMIDELKVLRLNSPVGGETVVHICIPDYPYLPLSRMLGDFDYRDKSGVVIIKSGELDKLVEE